MQGKRCALTSSLHAVKLSSHPEELAVLTCLWKQLAMLMRLWCIIQAGAAEKDVPLYKHLADLAGNAKLVTTLPSLAAQCLYHGMLNCSISSTSAFH